MAPAFEQIVREARERTGVPGVAAGVLRGGAVEIVADGVRELGRTDAVRPETPFRIASISKPFTAALCLACLEPDPRLRALLSHTAGLRLESSDPLPEAARGLFSYSNAGYWEAGALAAAACGVSFEQAMRTRVLEPLGLDATGYEEPPDPARGHLQEGETGHRAVAADVYPARRRTSGGLWSTVSDLLAFAAHQLETPSAAHEPQVEALGGRYALGWWVRELAGARTALEHEGSSAGYQSLLLLVPEERFALAVLTNSWRGSGLVRRVVEALDLLPASPGGGAAPDDVSGAFELDNATAEIEERGDGLLVHERELDPVTGAPVSIRYPVAHLGGGVFGFARGTLMSHRLDFPRPGLARVGWVALTRAGATDAPPAG
jgi:CubicO group peptidase (beta-lactamase class C family)